MFAAAYDPKVRPETRGLDILPRYAFMSDGRLHLKLKAAGHTRTMTAIHLKLRRMAFKKDGSFYSANSLAQVLGIDLHAVIRWINRGRLKATFRGTARGEAQNGDIYLRLVHLILGRFEHDATALS